MSEHNVATALELSRKAQQAERRAEDAEFHVEQLRDARDSAERRIEGVERLLDGWEHDGPDDPAMHLLIQRVREALNGRGAICTDCGHIHTPDGCAGPPTLSDRWAGVSPSACDHYREEWKP